MEVSVEATQGLERRLKVEVPAERVEQEVDSRLRNMARTVRLDGFRPGKVPFSVVQKRFGRQVRSEVVGEVMQSTLQEALVREQLQPAGQPAIEPESLTPGQPVTYTATFEVYPEFEPAALEGERIERPVAEITEHDIDNMVEKLRRQRRTWTPVERGAQDGDRVIIDFEGSVDGEVFPGGKGSQVPVQLGAGAMIPGFEEQLVGAAPGEERVIEVTFPDDYHSATVAGKPAQFKVKVHSVNAGTLPEVDEEFARGFGIGDGSVEQLRAEVRRNLERELEAAIRARLKNQVFDRLRERNAIDVPRSLVQEEAQRMVQQAQSEAGGGGAPDAAAFEDEARRRVHLGLVLGELIKRHNIQLDPDRVRRQVENLAASYENPEEVVNWYYQNQEQLGAIQSVVLEDQVVDWLVEQAQTEEKSTTFDELLTAQAAGDS